MIEGYIMKCLIELKENLKKIDETTKMKHSCKCVEKECCVLENPSPECARRLMNAYTLLGLAIEQLEMVENTI